jgi:hypothetical protein
MNANNGYSIFPNIFETVGRSTSNQNLTLFQK